MPVPVAAFRMHENERTHPCPACTVGGTAHVTTLPSADIRRPPFPPSCPPSSGLPPQTIDSLSPVERDLMERKLAELEACLQ